MAQINTTRCKNGGGGHILVLYFCPHNSKFNIDPKSMLSLLLGNFRLDEKQNETHTLTQI